MPEHQAHRERRLLMISPYLPQADGSRDRQYAWELLTIASRTHRVHLATLLDSPTRLEQWRTLARRTEKMAIAPRGFRSGGRRLHQQIRPWLAQHRFDAVLCGTTGLWPIVETIDTPRRICDVRMTPRRHWLRASEPALPMDVMTLYNDLAGEQLAMRLAADNNLATPWPIPVTQVPPLPLAA